MEQAKQGQQSQSQSKETKGGESALVDKEKFGDHRASEDLKHMGEKTREANQK